MIKVIAAFGIAVATCYAATASGFTNPCHQVTAAEMESIRGGLECAYTKEPPCEDPDAPCPTTPCSIYQGTWSCPSPRVTVIQQNDFYNDCEYKDPHQVGLGKKKCLPSDFSKTVCTLQYPCGNCILSGGQMKCYVDNTSSMERDVHYDNNPSGSVCPGS